MEMAGQEAHAFIARTRAQSEDFVRAELTSVQRFEDSLQRQYDGQLRSHVNVLQDECLEHVGQEEDKMRKELQHALAQESSIRHNQLQQALRQQVCQEEYADAESTREMNQLRQLIVEEAQAMQRFESHSQQFVSQQQEEYAHKQHAQFQQFDGVLRDQDEASPFFAAASTQPYATPVEKKTLRAVAAVAQAVPARAFHSPGLSLGASAGNLNIKSRSEGSSTVVAPVRRRLRTKTPPAAAQRVPSMRSKGPPPQPQPQPLVHQGQEEYLVQHTQEEEEGGTHLLMVAYPQDLLYVKLQEVHQEME